MDKLKPVDILLVEDNPANARIITDYFEDSKSNINFNRLKDGVDALDYLYQKEDYNRFQSY